MLTGDIPYKERDKYALMMKISTNTIAINFPDYIPQTFRGIIESCLRFDPAKRPTAHQLLSQLSSLSVTITEDSLKGTMNTTPSSLGGSGYDVDSRSLAVWDFSHDTRQATKKPSTVVSLQEMNSSEDKTTTLVILDSQPVS